MHAIAAERGGECLSWSYINAHSSLEWLCARGHAWSANAWNVINGSWCPACAQRKPRPRHTLAEMQSIAAERGGACLSGSYDPRAMQWRCAEGHKWITSPGAIMLGTWCWICSMVARRGKKRGGRKPLTLADARDLAAIRGGTCITSEWRSRATSLSWRCNLGHEWKATFRSVYLGNWCPTCGRHELASIESDSRALDTLQRIAKQHGGECLATRFTNLHVAIRWRCNKGHEWLQRGTNILGGAWCPACTMLAKKVLTPSNPNVRSKREARIRCHRKYVATSRPGRYIYVRLLDRSSEAAAKLVVNNLILLSDAEEILPLHVSQDMIAKYMSGEIDGRSFFDVLYGARVRLGMISLHVASGSVIGWIVMKRSDERPTVMNIDMAIDRRFQLPEFVLPVWKAIPALASAWVTRGGHDAKEFLPGRYIPYKVYQLIVFQKKRYY